MKIGVLGAGFGVVHLQTFLGHPLVAIRAMEHGKDVICEIPVCPTLAEA